MMISGTVGISTSLSAQNSTSFMLQNSRFQNVATVVRDAVQSSVLLAGGSGYTDVDSWGFGKVSATGGATVFVSDDTVAVPVRAASLTQTGTSIGPNQDYYFTRRRPSYAILGGSEVLDARAMGAQGDGVADDTTVLNYIFSAAANMSAIVYIPYGVYLVTDTIHIPVGSRIMGQAWPQIMGSGVKFSNANSPRAVVKVGEPGMVGVVEIQNMLFTTKGATAGAVLVEWNVRESFQGSAGLWGE
jgi:hypothetical protein